MTPSQERKYLAWLRYCLNIGWSKKDLPILSKIWIKYHINQGRKKPSE